MSVATAAPAGLYFIHTDHLNTPRLITNEVKQTAWASDDPFGNNAPNENPSGLGTFTCNLRLPGQYFDKETNLHYNYFRDYDPAIGRYVQSDPIGLAGGVNTYVYANDPLTQIDPFGLMGRGSGASQSRPSPAWPREFHDLSICQYYDRRCTETGCFYYCQSAPRVCRGAQSVPQWSYFGARSLNCVRRCLTEEDAKATKVRCDGANCLPDKVIDDYHQKCFDTCGVPLNWLTYPGMNMWGLGIFNLNRQ